MSVKSPTPTRRSTRPGSLAERPHLLDLLLSLVDARVSHVDLMDTTAGAEFSRYYRARRAPRRANRAAGPATRP